MTDGFWQVSDADYYADRSAVSRSMLEDLIRSPSLYHARHVARSIPDDEPTPAMVLGQAVHAAVFRPPGVVIATAPKVDRRTKAGKQAWEEFEATHTGCLIITSEQAEAGIRMVAAMSEHPLAGPLTRFVIWSERPIRWTDHRTGIACKAKPDALSRRTIDGRPVLVDLKTTTAPWPSEWPRVVASHGYHRQAAWYLRAAAAAGIDDARFVFVAVQSAAPWDVFCYELDDTALAQGAAECDAALDALARCQESGEWAAPESRQINAVSLPRWYYSKGEASVH